MDDRDKLYLLDGQWAWTGSDAESAGEAYEKLKTCASELGLSHVGGTVHRSRERDPIEIMSFAGEGVFRNQLAQGIITTDSQREAVSR